jgi:hypothetical protein
MTLGRTKATAIATGVLAPYSVEMVMKDLHDCSNPAGHPKYFSLSTDGGSRWNKKLFPHAIRYYDVNQGVVERILNLEESSDGTSECK